jgi:hypothetical protein
LKGDISSQIFQKESFASSFRDKEYAKHGRGKQNTACFLLIAWYVLHGGISSHPRRWPLLQECQIQFFGCPSSEENPRVAQEA